MEHKKESQKEFPKEPRKELQNESKKELKKEPKKELKKESKKEPKKKPEKEPKKEPKNEQKKDQKRKRNDGILIGCGLLAAALLFLLFRFLFRNEGTTAVVLLNGTVVMEQELSEDCRIPIQTEEGYNIFQVTDGMASIAEADCRDQICVNHTPISHKGETIVCLPHHLVVEIRD